MQEMNQETEPMVTVLLPEEGNGAYVDGAINGVNFRIPTGRVIEIPERIAAVLRDSQSSLRTGAAAVGAFVGAGGKRL